MASLPYVIPAVGRLPACPGGDMLQKGVTVGTPERAGEMGSVKVLVVDDDQPFLALMEIVLSLTSCVAEVKVAEHGLDALRACIRFRPDVVFVDSIMPGISGDVLGPCVRELLPSARLVSITGMSGKPAPVWADDHILKTGQVFDRIEEIVLGSDLS